jgi:hypothetical protein
MINHVKKMTAKHSVTVVDFEVRTDKGYTVRGQQIRWTDKAPSFIYPPGEPILSLIEEMEVALEVEKKLTPRSQR